VDKWQQQEFPMSIADFDFLRNLAYSQTGIVLPERKKQMVYSRLSRRIRTLRLSTFSQYCHYLENNTHELPEFINALTTNLTAFFREKHHFVHLDKQICPQWLASKQKRIRIWSAACSTGEEAYSIAMTLYGRIDLNLFDVKILATDLNTQVLETAKKGIYSAEVLPTIPANFSAKYIKTLPNTEQFSIKQRIKDLVHFKQLNLLQPWPMSGPFDVIFCRNVFIYFDSDTKQRIIKKFRALLNDGGYLIIGHAETINDFAADFEFVGHTIYRARKRKVPFSPLFKQQEAE